MPLFKPCREPGCDKFATVRGLCDDHYHHRKYLERRARLLKFDTSEAVKAISVCLAKFRDLRGGGVIDQLKFGALQHEFLGYHRQISRVVEDDYETNEEIEADEQYTERLLKNGAVQAESEEEARRLLAERDRPKLKAAEPKEEEEKE